MHANKSTVFPVKSGVDFCGFRVFPYYRKLRKANVKIFVKRVKKMQKFFARGEIGLRYISDSVMAWIAHASHGNTYKLRGKLLSRVVFKKGLASAEAFGEAGPGLFLETGGLR